MCNPVSFFASWHGDSRTVYISEKTDSHTEMAREFGIKDDGNGRLCAGEFHPDPAKPSPDTASWVIVWDHAGCDRKPDWLDDDALSGLRAELERRCAAYVFTTDGNTTSCRAFVFGSGRVVARGSSRVEAHGSSRVVAMSKYCVVVFRDNHDGMGYPAMIWNHNGSGTTTLAELKMQASKGDEG